MTPGFPTPPPLGVSLAGLSFATAPALLQWAAEAGFAAVRLDASALGTRPRDLDRSARRDLASSLRRRQLRLAGLDLWIPPAHFADPAHADRAADAVGQAIDLAADLARLEAGDAAVCLALPSPGADGPPRPADAVIATLADRADASGVDLADFAVPSRGAASAHTRIRAGIDPASHLQRGLDPAAEAARAGPRLAAASLSDVSGVARRIPAMAAGGSPFLPPLAAPRAAAHTRLDIPSYLIALATASYSRPLALDLRGVADPRAGAEAFAAAWNGALRRL